MHASRPAVTVATADTYRFGNVRIDCRRQILYLDGAAVDIEPKPLALLIALAEADGAVLGKAHLLDALWPRQSVTDAVLNQCVLRARQALGAHGHALIVTVHRQGYRLGVAVQSSPPAPGAATAPAAVARRHVQWFWPVLLAALLAAAAVLLQHNRVPLPPSVAVMPIAIHGGSQAEQRIAEGLGDALLTRLAQEPGLRVPARTSVHIAAAHREDVRRIGRELGVSHVLEALMRRAGDGHTLHASLVRSDDGFQQWARQFDIPAGGLAAAELQIVREVSQALGARSAASAALAPIGTDSDDAYKAYLGGRALLHQRTEPALRWAIENFAAALRVDPAFAAAHAQSAVAWMLLYEYSNLSLADARSAATAHIAAARQLAPQRADTDAAEGLLQLDSGDAYAAERSLRRAVTVTPRDATTLMWLGTALSYQGRLAEATHWHRQALALDPLSAIAEVYVGIDLALALDDSAGAHFDRAIAREPRLLESHWQYALFERFRGDPAAARGHLQQALLHDPSSEYTRALLAQTLLAAADVDAAAAVLGNGSDGSLANWLRSAIGVAVARGDAARAQALYRLCVDRPAPHPDDRVLAATALARLGDPAQALARLDAHIALSGDNDPFLRLAQADLGVPELLLYLDLVQTQRGHAAAQAATSLAEQRLQRLREAGIRVPPLDAAIALLRARRTTPAPTPSSG